MSGNGVGDPVESCPLKDEKKSWLEFSVTDEDGKPLGGHRYRLEHPDERTTEGVVGEDGKVRVEGVEKGKCKISFPDLDAKSWELKK